MKKHKIDKRQTNLFDWANKEAAERNTSQKEVAKEIRIEEPKQVEDNSSKLIDVPKVLLDWPIEKLELTIRTKHCLDQMNIKSIGELLKKSEEELLKCRGFGKKSISELNEILGKHNLSLKKDK